MTIERCESEFGSFRRLEALETNVGGIYRVVDTNVRKGDWWYRLVRRVNDLGEVIAGPSRVRVPAISAPTSLVLRGRNPVRDVARLGVELEAPAKVSLSLLDIRGRRVRELFSGELPSGPSDIDIDTRTIPSGVYFARLRHGRESTNLRIAVVH